ncbi:hypothetical protein ACG2DA_18725, partial [Alienimonas sp. DA493]
MTGTPPDPPDADPAAPDRPHVDRLRSDAAEQAAERELSELLELQLHGPANAARADRIAALLAASPDLRDVYVQHCQLHAMLAWEHGTVAQRPLEAAAPDAELLNPAGVRRRGERWRRVALAASLLLCCSVAWSIYREARGPAAATTAGPPAPVPAAPRLGEVVGRIENSLGARLR